MMKSSFLREASTAVQWILVLHVLKPSGDLKSFQI